MKWCVVSMSGSSQKQGAWMAFGESLVRWVHKIQNFEMSS